MLKATFYITDMDDFSKGNEIYEEFFPDQPLAQSCVEMSRLAKGANIAIEAIGWEHPDRLEKS